MIPVTRQNSQCLLYWGSEDVHQEDVSDIHYLCYPQVMFHHGPSRKYESITHIIYLHFILSLSNTLNLAVVPIVSTIFYRDAKDCSSTILEKFPQKPNSNILTFHCSINYSFYHHLSSVEVSYQTALWICATSSLVIFLFPFLLSQHSIRYYAIQAQDYV
jgi:hypothetical protein